MTVDNSSEKKQIKLDVKYRIQRGEPKQQIFEDLSPLYRDKATLVRTIEITPSKAMKAQYGMFNYLLAVLLFAALVLDFILVFKLDYENMLKFQWNYGDWVVNSNILISVILDAVFFVGVLMYRIDTYSWIASRALVTILTIVLTFAYFFGTHVDMLVYISLGLILVSLILGLFLGVKLCPSRVPKIVEIDIDGVEKINKTIYVFPD